MLHSKFPSGRLVIAFMIISVELGYMPPTILSTDIQIANSSELGKRHSL